MNICRLHIDNCLGGLWCHCIAVFVSERMFVVWNIFHWLYLGVWLGCHLWNFGCNLENFLLLGEISFCVLFWVLC